MSFISGNVIFSDSTSNASAANEILGTGVFQDNSYNLGVINDAKFLGNSQNSNIVLNTATFYDGAVNNCSVANAVFYGNSSNLGVIVESGVFYGTSYNSGVVSGNAVFADTSSNLGAVQGDASFADTVTSFGEVSGVTGSYVNAVDHQYSYTGSNSGVYWSNDQPLAVGSTLYADQYHNQTITFTNFQLEGSTYYVNVAGVVNYIMAPIVIINHPHQHDAYWSDDEVLIDGSILYTGEHTNSTANNITQFTEGDYYVNTDESGVVTLTYAVTHSYQHDAYWSDDEVLVNGSVLYVGQHNNTTANNVAQFTEGDYYVNTNGSGVVTLTYVINHPHQFGIYWTDTSPLANGDLLYVAEHTIEVAASYSGDLGNGPLTTDESGIVSYTYNYPYQHSSYWSDASSLANGSVLYVGQHNNTTANNVAQFTEGDYYVDTGGSGVVTLSYVINHPYSHSFYWSDDATLVDGSILYTGAHSNTTANNVQFSEGGIYIGTDGSGVFHP